MINKFNYFNDKIYMGNCLSKCCEILTSKKEVKPIINIEYVEIRDKKKLTLQNPVVETILVEAEI
jgi:hypothetical protein